MLKRVAASCAVVALAALTAVLGLAAPAAAASAAAWVSGSTLYYVDTPGVTSTDLVVRAGGGVFTLDSNRFINAWGGCRHPVPADNTRVSCAGGIDLVQVKMDGGDDFVDYLTDTTSKIFGMDGFDTLLGGDARDYLYGGPGNDYLDGYGFQDWLEGGPGADMLYGGAFWGDVASYADHTDAVNASLDGVGGNDGSAGEGDTIGADVEILEGGAGNDILTGNDDGNVLRGCGGHDQLHGLGGDDGLYGDGDGEYGEDGRENERWNGCPTAPIGDDLFSGGAGEDGVGYHLHADDVIADLDGASGDDGSAGERDTLGADIENLIGGLGGDTLTGNSGPNHLGGGPGGDVLYGLGGDDQLGGADGDDHLYGGAGADDLIGDDGNDLCDRGPGGLTAMTCEIVF